MQQQPLRVLAYALYGDQAASTRVRLLQYLPYLAEQGIQVDVQVLLGNHYLRSMFAGRGRKLGAMFWGYLARLWSLRRVPQYDVVWVYMELFPGLPGWAEALIRRWRPMVYDCDDAFFYRYEHSQNPYLKLLRHKIKRIMAGSAQLACGNVFLAEHARAAGARAQAVHVLPTVVDAVQYQARAYTNTQRSAQQNLKIGWIGSRTTVQHLDALRTVFAQLAKRFDFELVVIGARFSDAAFKVRMQDWQESQEISDIQQFDVGIMPLDDLPWVRGKCAYKLIQCMACAVPVVGERLGANEELIQNPSQGYLVRGEAEWLAALTQLLASAEMRQQIGQAGRERVERAYSLASQAPRLAAMLRAAAV